MQKDESLKQRLIKGAVGSFGLKVISTALAFGLNLLLARLLGTEGLGIYALAITWIGLLSIPAKLGFPQLLVRDIAIYSSRSQWGLLKGLLKRAYQIIAILSCTLALLMAILARFLLTDSQTFLTLVVTALSLPFSCLRSLNQAAMSGFYKVVQAQLPESLMTPCLMTLSILIFYGVLDDKVTPVLTVGCYAIVTLITFLLGLCQLSYTLPKNLLAATAEYKTHAWIRMALPFMMLGALYIVNSQADIVMLGAIQNAESVGLYVVANKIASIIVFILMASNLSLEPNIASLYALNQLGQLEKIIRESSKIVSAFSCTVAASIIFFRDNLLSLFGQEFSHSSIALCILVIGQLVNVLAGPVGLLLNMSGNERLTFFAFSFSAIVNILLNFYLIPTFNIEGAATATTISMVIWNLLSLALVITRLNINPTALGSSRARS
ncbi:MAG: flippase [Almyronema sp.]